MESKLFDIYDNKIKMLDVDVKMVDKFGVPIQNAMFYTDDRVVFEGMTFHRKTPHSTSYKKLKLSQEFFSATDNHLSAMSELLSEKVYRSHKFLTAKHFVLKKDDEFVLYSPNLFGTDIVSEQMNNINMFKPYYFNNISYKTRGIEYILQGKNDFLTFMTPECFDQYVEYLLRSVFEFSDDEHYSNIMFVKRAGKEKFEEMFIFDKESTYFNFLISRITNDFNQLKTILRHFSVSDSINISITGSFNDSFNSRVQVISQLFDRGLLNEKHLKFLKDIANTDFNKIARHVHRETKIPINDVQIDCYKYGAEVAGELAKTLWYNKKHPILGVF